MMRKGLFSNICSRVVPSWSMLYLQAFYFSTGPIYMVFLAWWRTEGAVRQPMVCGCVTPQRDVASESKVTTDLKQRKEKKILLPEVVTTGSRSIKCNKHRWILTYPVQVNTEFGGCNLVMKINWEQRKWAKGALAWTAVFRMIFPAALL